MVDSDSSEDLDSNQHKNSCWSWKLSSILPSISSLRTPTRNQRIDKCSAEGERNTESESLGPPTTNIDKHSSVSLDNKNSSDISLSRKRRPRSVGDISIDYAINSSISNNPNSNSSSHHHHHQDSSKSGGFFSFLNFTKSNTRHLERPLPPTLASSPNKNHSISNRISISSEEEEARYTKFPIAKKILPSGTVKSKSENSLSKNTVNLNSFQLGDHATIKLPWKGEQNNLNSSKLSHSKTVPTTFTNIRDIIRVERGEKVGIISSDFKERAKSLEKNTHFNVFSQEVDVPPPRPAKTKPVEKYKIVEKHPHVRLRSKLNPTEQEILNRNITNCKLNILNIPNSIGTSCSSSSSSSSSGETPNNLIKSKRIEVDISSNSSIEDSGLVISSSNSEPNFSVLNPSISAPPSPPPRPASTLKPNRSLIFPIESSDGGLKKSEGKISEKMSRVATLEDARSSGFINKPSDGWLHSDEQLTKDGVHFNVRYIGCLDVNTSMKSLDFDTRSLIAKECINQVCESARLKPIDKKRKIDRRLARILGFRPRLEHSSSEVRLTVTSTALKLTSLEPGGSLIANHKMPNISFASGGDVSMMDYIAYVAKDDVIGRACFVLECGTGLAQDVITTIGQAFELRFKEFLQKRPPKPLPPKSTKESEVEYYNDLPGKVGPDESSNNGSQQQPSSSCIYREVEKKRSGGNRTTPTLTLPNSDKEMMSVNLIDFEAPTPPAFDPKKEEKNIESILLAATSSTTIEEQREILQLAQKESDPFDMQPFENSLGASSVPSSFLNDKEKRDELSLEPWFHGVISRGAAEALLVNDGDFLVRESQTTPGQYVLTGFENGSPKHLLLVNPEGEVRTKDRSFESVSHLIKHHSESSRPIISAESMVLLRNPLLKNP